MPNLMSINNQSEFSTSIYEIFEKYRPTKLIETGTYKGLGSTTIIASTLLKLKIENFKFISIEVNPAFCLEAIQNLKKSGLFEYVDVKVGLSIFRNQLPNKKKIEDEFIKKSWPKDIYIDHSEWERIDKYFAETDFPWVPEGVLSQYLKKFDYVLDFVLLDSGGHIGESEFDLVISSLKGFCIIALDDVFHVKHHLSLSKIQKDPRFEILKLSKEKFGFCIAAFSPIIK